MKTTLVVPDAAQIPIAHHAIHLAIMLIDPLQTLQDNREECAELVTRAGNIIVNVHDQLKPLFLLLGDNMVLPTSLLPQCPKARDSS
ncbi:hypothetical protein FRC03_011608 [Tulasnella sp. 419]|nr:hypothetical protein FRC03_011608 [Tulasnella sp. 419]